MKCASDDTLAKCCPSTLNDKLLTLPSAKVIGIDNPFACTVAASHTSSTGAADTDASDEEANRLRFVGCCARLRTSPSWPSKNCCRPSRDCSMHSLLAGYTSEWLVLRYTLLRVDDEQL